MKLRIPALVIALTFASHAFSQTDTTQAPASAPESAPAATAPAQPEATPASTTTAPASTTTTPAVPANSAANDTARFLAGLPPSVGSPLTALAAESSWIHHSNFFDSAWTDLDKKQLAKVRAWDAAYIPDASKSNTPVFYMFSGPDYLYVNTFYPNASTYVLCGIEPVGSMPDLTKIKPGTLGAELQDLQTSLNSVLSFSFFITKDMKTELQNHEINGTLPLILIFIARAGNTVDDVSFVGIDANGKVQPVAEPAKNHSLIPGVKITLTQPNAAQSQTVYYFDTDISDDGIKKTPGFLKFCESLAPGNSFVKSASYLMHENYFATIRSFLLKNSLTLIQDDSGVPVSFFTPDKWMMRYFGSYPGPIELFKKYVQPELTAVYHKSHPVPLGFGIGYRHYASESTLILATRKSAEAAQPTPAPAAPSATPAPSAAPATSVVTPPAAPDQAN